MTTYSIGLNIALDFDDTFTAAPEMWRRFIELAKSHGNRVFIVTARNNTESDLHEIRQAVGLSIPVVMCGNQQKRAFCINDDLKIDIWIDDYPEAIVGDKESLELCAAYDEIARLTKKVYSDGN